MSDTPPAWSDALGAAALFAVDPAGTGGVVLRAAAGPVRDRWLAQLRALLPSAAPWRRVPLGIGDGRLLGGLDLAATLGSGRAVAERGLLAEADGGVLLLAMAERLSPGTAGRLAAVLDAGEVLLERDGFGLRLPARLGLVALDEGLAEDERPPAALLDRLAFGLDLDGLSARDSVAASQHDAAAIAAARTRLAEVEADEGIVRGLCEAALALGVPSLRAPLLALRAARAAAALAGRDLVTLADAALAGRLVLAPRATRLPAAEPQERPEPPAEAEAADPPPPPPPEGSEDEEPAPAPGEVVLAAARAAIPPGLLASLQLAGAAGRLQAKGGKAGAQQAGLARGRPAGIRRGEPRAGARLNLIETLRAAAPWQGLRRAEAGRGRIEVRREDFRLTRLKQRRRTTTIFAVDASGSAAFHRLAEAKGAVELLLADCYVRRDRVALIAFRGPTAELLLPPTRSLVRAKRGLAGLPGGGGTPLAAGLDAAAALAAAVQRRGETPIVILLTDGRANIARDGLPGRARAGEEALGAARQLAAAGLTSLLVDTSPLPQASARALAAAMGAAYLPLPRADAAALSQAVRATAAAR